MKEKAKSEKKMTKKKSKKDIKAERKMLVSVINKQKKLKR